LILKIKESFDTSGITRPKTRRHIPEDMSLHQHRCEKVKSRMGFFFWNAIFKVSLVFLVTSPSSSVGVY
jgi:hypothetical protein